MNIPHPDPTDDSEVEPPALSYERPPQPPSLRELAQKLGFEDWDERLKQIESEILNDNLQEDARIIRLLSEYQDTAGSIMDKKGTKRDARVDLALILQIAHFRYKRWRLPGLWDDLMDISEALDNPEIDDDIYKLVSDTITVIRNEILEYILAQVPKSTLIDTIRTVLSDKEIVQLYLLAQTKRGD